MPPNLIRKPSGGSRWQVLKRDLRRAASGFVPRGHGTSVEGFSELWTFSGRARRNKFEAAGFQIVEDRPMGLFYTGNLILGARLSLKKRRSLCRTLGSATRVYKVAGRTG